MDAPDNTGGEMKFLIPSIFSFPVVFTTPAIFVPSIEGGNENDFAPVISCVPVVRTTVDCSAEFGIEVAAKFAPDMVGAFPPKLMVCVSDAVIPALNVCKAVNVYGIEGFIALTTTAQQGCPNT